MQSVRDMGEIRHARCDAAEIDDYSGASRIPLVFFKIVHHFCIRIKRFFSGKKLSGSMAPDRRDFAARRASLKWPCHI
jgi:hypothetical protein